LCVKFRDPLLDVYWMFLPEIGYIQWKE
jgi:hypothetical protein